MEGYMTVEQAAEQLGVSADVIRKRLQRGQIKGERAGRRMWLISVIEVERWRGVGKLPRGPKPKG